MIPTLDSLMNLIHKQSQYCNQRLPACRNMDYEDIVQEGVVCYYIWAERFDPAKGCKFITGFCFTLQNRFADLLHHSWKKDITSYDGFHNKDDEAYDVEDNSPKESEDFRVEEILNVPLARIEHLMARALLRNWSSLRRREMYKALGLKQTEGKRILESLGRKLRKSA